MPELGHPCVNRVQFQDALLAFILSSLFPSLRSPRHWYPFPASILDLRVRGEEAAGDGTIKRKREVQDRREFGGGHE